MPIIKEACGDKISIFVGVDDLSLDAFPLHCTGCVSGGSNVIPSVVKRLYNLIVNDDGVKAAREQ